LCCFYLVNPVTCNVAAVVRIMKYMTRLERNIPAMTSIVESFNSSSLAPRRSASVVLLSLQNIPKALQ
jgi:hypothetical protein